MTDKITVTVNGQSTEFFMSFGLLKRLATLFSDVTFLDVSTNPSVHEALMQEVLRKVKPNVEAEEFDVDDYGVSIEDVEKIVDWATEHVVDFLARRAQSLKDLSVRKKDQMSILMPSLGGLPDSDSMMPSAGASTTSPAD